eukprot:2996246-Alexandrium_andersonii.AAC.1
MRKASSVLGVLAGLHAPLQKAAGAIRGKAWPMAFYGVPTAVAPKRLRAKLSRQAAQAVLGKLEYRSASEA